MGSDLTYRLATVETQLALTRRARRINRILGELYPDAHCEPATCQLTVGFFSSANGGATWSVPTQLAGPMSLDWLANTSKGRFVGEYISTVLTSDGLAHPIFPTAHPPSGAVLDEAINTPTGGLAVDGGTPPAS